MLGHIAIATMGGCFSQNPDTGAAEATYFPAESVLIQGNFRHQKSREPGTTDFRLGFTQTYFWAKLQSINCLAYNWPALVALGTAGLAGGVRTMAFCGIGINNGRPSVAIMTNDTYEHLSSVVNPTEIWICKKESGADTTTMTNGTITSTRVTVPHVKSLTEIAFAFIVGPANSTDITRFWGDRMSNEPYDIHWHRLPMQCTETPCIALYEVVGKELVEY